MRQIVRNNRQIVQPETAQARMSALTCGLADAATWFGETEWFQWSLDSAIGYLLPIDEPLEASCAAGVINRIKPGELLIINRAEAESFRLQLRGAVVSPPPAAVTAAALVTEPAAAAPTAKAAMGHIRLKSGTDTFAGSFANAPARAMSLLQLTSREHARVATLSRLVADELTAVDKDRDSASARPGALVMHLEKALYEALAQVLCACDPLGLPQIVAMADSRLTAALRAMIDNPARAWRLDTLAREAALSRTLFATRFKLMLGITPLEYLTQLRVQLAATLKAEAPQRTLHDIAQAVGYADESSLRRAYQRVAGHGVSGQAAI